MTTTTRNHAEQNAAAWAESISACWAAVRFCGDQGQGRLLPRDAKAILKAQGYDGTNHAQVLEWIEDEMRESPLSVDIRDGWRSPGESESMEPTEFQILLSTGGPALRIVGELSNGQPCHCWLEHQDWDTPWTPFQGSDRCALLWFAGLFWFGD